MPFNLEALQAAAAIHDVEARATAAAGQLCLHWLGQASLLVAMLTLLLLTVAGFSSRRF